MCHGWLVQAESPIITVIPITAYLKSGSMWLRLLFSYWFNFMTVTNASNNKIEKLSAIRETDDGYWPHIISMTAHMHS